MFPLFLLNSLSLPKIFPFDAEFWPKTYFRLSSSFQQVILQTELNFNHFSSLAPNFRLNFFPHTLSTFSSYSCQCWQKYSPCRSFVFLSSKWIVFFEPYFPSFLLAHNKHPHYFIKTSLSTSPFKKISAEITASWRTFKISFHIFVCRYKTLPCLRIVTLFI